MVWAPTTAGGYLTVQLVLTAPLMGSVLAAPFFFNDAATPEIYALSLHDALPILPLGAVADSGVASVTVAVQLLGLPTGTVSGVQLARVLARRFSTLTTKVPALLSWVASPL